MIEKPFATGLLTINCAEGAPNGPPFVMLHGISARWQAMASLIRPLEEHWQVFACDLRGHGKSDRADSYRAIDYFPDVAAFVEGRVGTPVVLLGHSGGAIAVLGGAVQIPQLVRAVVLLDPPICRREGSIQDKNINIYMTGVLEVLAGRRDAQEFFRGIFPGIDEKRVHWFAETIDRVDPEAVRPLLDGRYFDGLDLQKLLARAYCPVLMLYGEPELGGMVRESDVRFFRAHTGDGTVVQIKESGHNLQMDQPERVLTAVSQWLEEVL